MWSSQLTGGLRPAGPPRAVAAAMVMWIGAQAALSACPICFQVEDAGVTAGVRAAVAVLGGVTGGVLIGVAVFARRLVKTERAEQK